MVVGRPALPVHRPVSGVRDGIAALVHSVIVMADHVDRHDLQRAAAERRAEQHRQAQREAGTAERPRAWLATQAATQAAAAADADARRRGAEQRRLAALTRAREPSLATLWQEQRHDARVAANIVKVAEARRAAAWPQRRHTERGIAEARAEALRELVQARRHTAQRTDQHVDDRKQRRK